MFESWELISSTSTDYMSDEDFKQNKQGLGLLAAFYCMVAWYQTLLFI